MAHQVQGSIRILFLCKQALLRMEDLFWVDQHNLFLRKLYYSPQDVLTNLPKDGIFQVVPELLFDSWVLLDQLHCPLKISSSFLVSILSMLDRYNLSTHQQEKLHLSKRSSNFLSIVNHKNLLMNLTLIDLKTSGINYPFHRFSAVFF